MAGIFDKVVVGINRGVNTVSEGSKVFVEKARINTQIEDLEKEKNSMLLNMGNLVYNLHQSGEVQIAQCEALCNEITAYIGKITDMQNQLQALDAQKAQPVYNNNTPDNNTPDGAGAVICGQCGARNKSTSKFCSGCGSPLV